MKFVGNYDEPISQIDLEKSINLTGLAARLHYGVLVPGGTLGQHHHAGRPAFEYMLQGQATETRRDVHGKVVVRSVTQHEGESSTREMTETHWWVNESDRSARLITVDVYSKPQARSCNCTADPRNEAEPFKPPATLDPITIESLGMIDLGPEFPAIPAARDYVMRSRRITLLPHQATPVQMQPSYTYVVLGSPVENRSDSAPSSRRPESFSIAAGDISSYWENPTPETVVLWVVDFVRKGAGR